MNRKKLVLGLGCALLLAGSAVVLAGIGGDNSNSDLNDNDGFPGGGDDCICTQQYAPVVCIEKNPDGTLTKQTFSNACFAACAGFTNCFGVVTLR